jgi:hypothetical protein
VPGEPAGPESGIGPAKCTSLSAVLVISSLFVRSVRNLARAASVCIDARNNG